MGGVLTPIWDAISRFFMYVRDQYGYDFVVFYDSFFAAKLGWAIVETVKIAVLVLIFSFAIGLCGAAYRFRARTVGRSIIDGYIAVFRNTPSLAQLYFLYFGLGSYLVVYPDLLFGVGAYLDGFFWLILALSLHFGAYNIESFRAGLEAVPASTIEAAHALGYTPEHTMWRIQMPLAFRIALPSLSNNLVQIVKTSAIGYAVAVPEVLYVANRIWAEKLNVVEMMNVVLVTYLLLIGIFVFLAKCLERSLHIPGTRN